MQIFNILASLVVWAYLVKDCKNRFSGIKAHMMGWWASLRGKLILLFLFVQADQGLSYALSGSNLMPNKQSFL